MSKYIIVSLGDSDTPETSLKNRSLAHVVAVDLLSEARDMLKTLNRLSELNFVPTESKKEFKSVLKIIKISEIGE